MILKSSKRFYFAKRRTCLWTRVILSGFSSSFTKTKDFLPAFINVQAFYVHLPILDLNKKKYVNEAVSFKVLHNEINKHIHQITLGMLENKNI